MTILRHYALKLNPFLIGLCMAKICINLILPRELLQKNPETNGVSKQFNKTDLHYTLLWIQFLYPLLWEQFTSEGSKIYKTIKLWIIKIRTKRKLFMALKWIFKNFNQFYVNVFIYFHFFHCSASRVTRQSSLVLLENKVIAYFQSYCRTLNQIKNT